MQAKVDGVVYDNRAELALTAGAGIDFASAKTTQGDLAMTLGAPGANLWLPGSALVSNLNRLTSPFVATVALPASGTMLLTAISLPLGIAVSSISFLSGGTAASGPTHQLFGLYDSSRNLLATSNDDTNTAWAANTVKTLAMTGAWTTLYDGLYYLAIMVTVSTTMPTMTGIVPTSTNGLAQTPLLNGTSNTGLTTTLPTGPATAITTTANIPYAWVS